MEQSEKRKNQLEKLMGSLPQNTEKRLIDIPGIFYGGGCSYMACRGLMMSPMSDVLLITHGPTGCGCFSGLNSRHDGGEGDGESFRGRSFSTNMREPDIIFGGEGKLLEAIGEAVTLYHPKVIAICATCPVGLIGDDIDQVAATAEQLYDIRVLPLSCEGFRSHNQGGWMLGGKKMVETWMGEKERPVGKFPIHFMSESYNREGKRVYDDLFSRIGYEVVCSMMGANTYDRVRSGHQAKLIVLDSGKPIDPVPREIQQKFGGGFFRLSFTGVSNTVSSLRKMAAYFNDRQLSANTERVISEELASIEEEWTEQQRRFSAYSVAIFEDIFRSDSFAALTRDLGMEVIMVAEDFSADEKTDEGFTLHCSLENYRKHSALLRQQPVKQEEGRVWFRLNRAEVGEMLSLLRPDLCFAGIQEQFGYNAAPIQSELFTSDSRGVSYMGFGGLLRFAKDLEMAFFMSHWLTQPPCWEKEGKEGTHLGKL